MPDIPFTVFSGIACVICLPPFYFNWKSPVRAWATLILIGWIFLLNLIQFMNSIIWRSSDLQDWWNGKGYCDVAARLQDMFVWGVPGAAIGICRFLADATDPDPSQTDLKHTQFKRNLIDFFLGIILPIILIGLKFIVESSRYHIVGVSGCSGVAYPSVLSIFIFAIWCPLLCLVAAGYACASLHLLH